MNQSVFLSMEMQTGTEKLAEALLLRGFPVRLEKEFITLKNGSEQDYIQLKTFLDRLKVPVFWIEDKFQLLINNFPLQKMKEIIYFDGQEHMVHMEGYHFKWRSFVIRRYGIRTNTIDLCPFTAIMVKALNEAGIVTLTGCNGHGKHNPNFQLSGVYYGIWFSIIQQRYMKALSLHYNWKVKFITGASNSIIVADKHSNESWDMKKILSDSYQMANVLINNAPKIRECKKQLFKRNMKLTAEELRFSGNIQQLFDWMKKITSVKEDISF